MDLSLRQSLVPASASGSSTRSSVLAKSGRYLAKLAIEPAEKRLVYELRFKVFNLEMNEGLDEAFATGRDEDEFDRVCDHIYVQDEDSGDIIGTYRMQTGAVALRGFGFYSEREFDFTPFRGIESNILELGRACVIKQYRSYEVLSLLWRAVALYAIQENTRYLLGCSSIPTQDPAVAWSLYQRLSPAYEVDSSFRTQPTPEFAMPESWLEVDARIPKLLRTYLAIGAKICGPPALDREFKTADFLTVLDLQAMSPTAKARFFRV